MVIVLTGTQAINKKFLSRIILANLNTFEYKGYVCDFSHSDIKIHDGSGKLVYKLSSIEGGVIGVEETPVELTSTGELPAVNRGEDDGIEDLLHNDPEVVEYFLKLNKDIFEDGIKVNHFVNRFCSLDVDFDLIDTPSYMHAEEQNRLLHPHDFDDVLNNIKNFAYPVKVITGTFGSYFIDALKAALPDEEVHVVSIIRNPSVAWLMNKKPDTKWNSPTSPDLTEALDIERFYEAAINAVELAKRSDVKVVKFEDVLADGVLHISEGISIDVRDDYRGANKWISNYEANTDILMSEQEFAPFNDLFMDLTLAEYYVPSDDIDEEVKYGVDRPTLMAKIGKQFPKNLFNDLGYSPLSRDEILKI